MKDVLHHKLTAAFRPAPLAILDNSAAHAGHPGAPAGSNSHYDITIISELFQNLRQVERHRKVYHALGDLWQHSSLHALQLKTLTPQEWQEKR
jgi:BolA protein